MWPILKDVYKRQLQLIGHHYPEVTNDPLWPQLLSDINYMSQLLSELSSLNSSQTLHYSQIDIRQFLTNIVSAFQSTVQLQTKEIRLNFETEDVYKRQQLWSRACGGHGRIWDAASNRGPGCSWNWKY